MKLHSPAVSIVIPCYNLGEFLQEAVDSCLQQTRAASEIIVVDDGSTDEATRGLIDSYEQSGIVTVLRTPNRGAPAARNHGIRHARADYILCLDADDALEPAFLERTVPLLDAETEVGIVATGVHMFGAFEGDWHPPDFAPVTMLWRNCIPSASLFRRICWEQTGGYPDLPACQDWGFWLGVIRQGWKWKVVPDVLYRYRRRAGSISEFREANRAEILRKLMGVHSELYGRYGVDLHIEMDAELNRLQERLRTFRRDYQQNTETIRKQAATISAQAERIARLEQDADDRGSAPAPPAGARPVELVTWCEKEIARTDARLQHLARDLKRLEGVQRICDFVERHVPRGASVLVATHGDSDLLNLRVRRASHFPHAASGQDRGNAFPDEALRQLEESIEGGAQYLIVPAAAAVWLDQQPGLRKRLETHYKLLAEGTECVIYEFRPRVIHHTFSVIICTYKRAELLGKTLDSVFAQDYPRDCFEVIVIDNNSPDRTAEVVREAAARSPVPLSYHVEPRNGLSHARNLGVASSRHEYVAFLDDDATACTGWLAAFNEVITEHHALVVGGRVEHAYDPDFTPPAWFQYPYLRGFYGINYRDRGKLDRVFRIRAPYYIGGGNCAYARRLFEHFGGYDGQLGRDARTLLAAEETYLNRVMERADVPIYYTDDAVIHHYVSPSRVDRKHLLRKAYWSGISNVITSVLLDGYPDTRARTKSSWKELRRLAERMLKAPRDAENFSRLCRAVYSISFVASFWRVEVRRLLFGRVYHPQHSASWGTEEWIREMEGWPDTEDKYRELYEILLALGDEERARTALDRLAELRPAGAANADRALESLRRPLRHLEYRRLVEHVRESVDAMVPTDGRVLVVSRGDGELLQLGGRKAGHFPQLDDGTYLGYHPADSADAIRHLESLHARGFEYLVLPRTAYWWLDHYVEFRQHLEKRYAVAAVPDGPCLVIPMQERPVHSERVNGHKPTIASPARA